MLVIRLMAQGSVNRKSFRVVATDKRARRDGRFVEVLGLYNPQQDQLVLKHDRIEFHLGNGAQMSDTVRELVAYSKMPADKKAKVEASRKAFKARRKAKGAAPKEEAAAPA
jgi:small subunit ribosomal protein S16